jgi:hypothetical protein
MNPERDRQMGPYGPMPLPEEMASGRVQCRALCSSWGRDYDQYTYEGACVCKPARNAAPKLKPENQT